VLTAGCASSTDDEQPAADQPAGFGLDAYGLSTYGSPGSDDSSDSATEPDDEPQEDDSEEDTAVESLPNVLTVKANTTASSATLWGLVWTLEECDSVDVFFEYRRADAEDWKETETTTLTNWGAFDQTASDLCPSTQYEYRAVVATDDGPDVGDTKLFETPDGEHDN